MLGRIEAAYRARAEGEAPDPHKHWLTPPFDPQISDGIIYARGSTDNKGQIFSHITGVAETLSAEGALPALLLLQPRHNPQWLVLLDDRSPSLVISPEDAADESDPGPDI